MGGVPCLRELATSSLVARTPRSCRSLGKRQLVRTPEAKARARGAASTPPRSSRAALRKSSPSGPVRAGCWRTRTATSSSWSAVTPARADQAVADDLGGAGGAGQGAFQGGDALVEVLVAAFDQAVGVEDGGGARAERDGAGAVDPAAGAERGPGGFVGAQDGAVLVADEDGQVAGRGVDQPALVGVVDGVDAGGDLVGVDLGGEAVEELEHLVRGQVEAGIGADGGAQLAHDGRRADAAAHDVADDEGGAAAAEGDDVVPVAADGGLGAAGLVGGGDAQVVGLFEFLGQQGALEGDGGLALSRSLARSRSAASAWSVTSVAKTSTPPRERWEGAPPLDARALSCDGPSGGPASGSAAT